jgi:hypothetical protein
MRGACGVPDLLDKKIGGRALGKSHVPASRTSGCFYREQRRLLPRQGERTAKLTAVVQWAVGTVWALAIMIWWLAMRYPHKLCCNHRRSILSSPHWWSIIKWLCRHACMEIFAEYTSGFVMMTDMWCSTWVRCSFLTLAQILCSKMTTSVYWIDLSAIHVHVISGWMSHLQSLSICLCTEGVGVHCSKSSKTVIFICHCLHTIKWWDELIYSLARAWSILVETTTSPGMSKSQTVSKYYYSLILSYV